MEQVNFPDATVRHDQTTAAWITIVITAYYAMLAIGIQATALIGIVTGSALAVGLALQGTLANVASGVMLLILRPISVDDYITAAGIRAR